MRHACWRSMPGSRSVAAEWVEYMLQSVGWSVADEPMGDQDDARTMKTMKIPSYHIQYRYSHQQGFQEKNQQGFKKNQQTENTEGQRRIFRSSSGLGGKMTESPSCHPLPPTAKTTKIPSPSHRLGCGPESEGDRRFFGVTTAKTMKIPSPRPPPGQ